ncbi:hypothetical protein LNTAR_05919 [Lentisphaera araneosa HTCC2155]|uniref:hydroxymethylpyrimidine kinase n=1 Tax=Lentisphaera araneosa HTCC2155 TaxID=313628 RepID=A6DPJ2_9BACT|nr:hydroxymethylpyrimidine/phosphomethylpyrimidine kinase [Lentisphaera araneosa]EDM26488.1 hypothetical protein LNTAR_05919 [Lentisphaera araneosa HTCC2155]
MINKLNTCLTIAGADSGGEAGVQADLQVFNYFNCHALSVLSATTAQSYSRVLSVNPVGITAFEDQLEVVFSDFQPACIKTGMLVDGEYINVFLERKPSSAQLVVDPLMMSTSGTELLEKSAWGVMRDLLIPSANMVTPNFPELRFLLGIDEVMCGEEMVQRYFDLVQVPVYLKGGHNAEAPSIDFFIDESGLWSLKTDELEIKASHGTGCRVSSALTAGLSNGLSGLQAAINTKKYLHQSLKSYKALSDGQYVMAPFSSSLDQVNVEIEKLV